MTCNLASFTNVLDETQEIANSQPISLSPLENNEPVFPVRSSARQDDEKPEKHTGQQGEFRSVEEIAPKYRSVFSYPYFNVVQSSVIEDALYSDKSMVVCAPTGSGKTVVFEMAIVQLLMALEPYSHKDFKIIYMAPVKALCTERLTEWYPKFTPLGLHCIEVTGDTDVDFSQLSPYRIIITTPEKWDMLTRRWRDHRLLVGSVRLFLVDEVHILNDSARGPVLEAVVSRMKTIQASSQSAYRIEQLQKQYQNGSDLDPTANKIQNQPDCPGIRFVAVSATVSNPEDVAAWLGTNEKPAVYYKFGDECRPVKLKRVVEGYSCPEGCSVFKFDIILSYKLWPLINKYYDGKPTLIFCNTRKSVALTAETLAKEVTVNFSPELKAKLAALASTIKNKKLQSLVLSGVGCHHAGLLYEERLHIEQAFRNRELPILITTTTLAMGVNLPAHLVIIKNTQQYVNGQYQEYSISTVLQMVGRAGRPQFDTEATAVIMTRLSDKARYQALVGGDEPLQSYLHKRLAENLNSEAALGTVTDVAQCVQWLRSTFLYVRAAKEPKRYLALQPSAPAHLISNKLEELCVKAMNQLASSGLISMDDASCIESTDAGRLMSIYYLDVETMKHIMKINGSETLEQLVLLICESHELSDMHLRMDERRCLNALNRNNNAKTIRYPMKGKINTRQMKLNCMIQAVLGCLPIPDPSLNQEAMKIIRTAERVVKCLVAYVTRSEIVSSKPQYYQAVLNSLMLGKCIAAQLWENSPYVSKQLRGIGPTFSTLLASAGKTSFMLLEESHPRDLERIMNKGPPLGNMIRKQVSLLPKYQLTATPRDENVVSLHLLLLNQAYLSENMDNLTAGDRHKSYILVGDSQNHLLLLTSFQDKDLISVYDGSITYEITRLHNFEHKIFMHCISADFVGIDAQCEYTFQDLTSFTRGEAYLTHPTPDPKKVKRQTTMTDTYKERKRKNETPITQSKEKKKRECAIVEKFQNLKESFQEATRGIREDQHKTSILSNKTNYTYAPNTSVKPQQIQEPNFGNTTEYDTLNDTETNSFQDSMIDQEHLNPVAQNHEQHFDIEYPEMILEQNDEDNFFVDDHVDDILSEIENEISKKKDTAVNTAFITPNTVAFKTNSNIAANKSNTDYEFARPREVMAQNIRQKETYVSRPFTKPGSYKPLIEKRKRKPSKSNFSYIDTIESKINSNDNEETTADKEGGFSDAIRNQIQNFLNSTKSTQQPDIVIQNLVDDNVNSKDNKKKEDNMVDLTLDEMFEANKSEGENTMVDLTEEETRESREARGINTMIDLTMEVQESPDTNTIPPESQRPVDINLSELPEVNIEKEPEFCEDRRNKINARSLIKTAEWLNTEPEFCVSRENEIKAKYCRETDERLMPGNMGYKKYQDLDEQSDSDQMTLKKYTNGIESNNDYQTNKRDIFIHTVTKNTDLPPADYVSEPITKDKAQISHNNIKVDEKTCDNSSLKVDTRSLIAIFEQNRKLTQQSNTTEEADIVERPTSKDAEGNNVGKKYSNSSDLERTINYQTNMKDHNFPVRDNTHLPRIDYVPEQSTKDKAQISYNNLKVNEKYYNSSLKVDTHSLMKQSNAREAEKVETNTYVNTNNIDKNHSKSYTKETNSNYKTPHFIVPINYPIGTFKVPPTSKIISDENVPVDYKLLFARDALQKDHISHLTPVKDYSNKLLQIPLYRRENDSRRDNYQIQEAFDKKLSLGVNTNMTLAQSHERVNCLNGEVNTITNIEKPPTQDPAIEAFKEYLNSLSNEMKSKTKNKKLENVGHSNDQYVKTYSYSASQLNVSTKNTQEHEVKIITKLKLGLDVTEIISKRTETFKENIAKEEQPMKCFESQENPGGQLRGVNQLESSHFNKPIALQYDKREFLDQTQKSGRKEARKFINNNKVSSSPILMECKSANDIVEQTSVNNKTNEEKLDQIHYLSINTSNDTYERNLRENDMTNEPQTEEKNQVTELNNKASATNVVVSSKVGNIIDKYKNILRKNTVDIKRISDSQKSSTETMSQGPEKTKIKRPLKISDIHKADASLPKILEVEVSRSQRPTNEEILSRVKAIERNVCANIRRETEQKYTNTPSIDLKVTEESDIDENIKYEDIIEDITEDFQNYTTKVPEHSPIYAPEHLERQNPETPDHDIPDNFQENSFDISHLEETPIDYDIEQDMLDPKSLLKRFTQDESDKVIIPPPMEFCDDDHANAHAYSPNPGKDTDYNYSPETTGQYESSDESFDDLDNVQENYTHDRSIFVENTRNTLTPSKEIETWTFLADEEEIRPRSKFLPPLKSFTVMNNPGVIQVPSRPVNSRNEKLSQFKAPKKEKLKL